jgi:hypothetical protein
MQPAGIFGKGNVYHHDEDDVVVADIAATEGDVPVAIAAAV